MKSIICTLALCVGMNAVPLLAQDMTAMGHHREGLDHADMGHKMGHGGMGHGHGPINVVGRHLMPEGKFMLTLRAGHMEMSGGRSGTSSISPVTVATTIPNRFFGNPGQPPTLRVVPTRMKMDMTMVGAMYGLSDKVTLMAMVPYIRKEMTALTFAGAAGTTVLGSNTMKSEGWGDIRVGTFFGLYQHKRAQLNGGLMLSLPTGSISETGQMLTPMNTRPVRRMAYGMQLGSGTYDLMPSLSYQNAKGRWAWGVTADAVIRLGSNSAGYSLGDQVGLHGWVSYKPATWVSYSVGLEARHTGRIDGIDANIAGPMQGADPLNYGGETVDLHLGVDLTGQRGALKGHRLGLTVGLPVYQRANGVQMERDWSMALAWRKSF